MNLLHWLLGPWTHAGSQKLDFSCFSQAFCFFLRTCRNSSRCILSDLLIHQLEVCLAWGALLCARAVWADRAAAFGGHVLETLPSGLLPPGSICLTGVWLHAESSVDRTRSHSQTHGFACVLFSSESVEDAEGLHAFVTPCQDYRDSGPLQGPRSVHGHDGDHIYSARAPPHCLPVALRTGN